MYWTVYHQNFQKLYAGILAVPYIHAAAVVLDVDLSLLLSCPDPASDEVTFLLAHLILFADVPLFAGVLVNVVYV
jgi:hypothetical protein